jgi:small subunit ribosomal protein S14
MAKKSKIVREKKLKYLVEKYSEVRKDLKSIILNSKSTLEEKEAAVIKLDNLPRRSSSTRIRNRCFATGRPRGILKKFNLSRLCFREMALKGEIPGITKASW